MTYKLPSISWRRRARRTLCRVLVLTVLAGCLAVSRAQTILTNASIIDLQNYLANPPSDPWQITLQFTNTLTTTTPLFINHNITLVGPAGATNSVIISGGSASGVFIVSSGFSFTVSNLTITGGNVTGTAGLTGATGSTGGSKGGGGGNGGAGVPGAGGGIFNQGTTKLFNCVLTGNNSSGGDGGAGGTGGNGSVTGGNGGKGGNGGSGFGGAIYNAGTLVLSNCTVASNSVVGGNGGSGGTNGAGGVSYAGSGGSGAIGAGAGLYNAPDAVAWIWNSTFNNNSCSGGSSQAVGGPPSGNGNGAQGLAGALGEGGGLFNVGTNRIINCTFYQNQSFGGNGGNGGNSTFENAGAGGNGGNAFGGGLYNDGFMAVTNCTFASSGVFGGTNGLPGTGVATNSFGSMGVARGANIANAGGTFIFENSLLAFPTNSTNAYGTITTQSFNLSSDSSPKFQTNTHSRNNVTNTATINFLGLQPLTANGGPTATMAIGLQSLAVAAVTNGTAPLFDQRGIPRNSSAACIGAFELVLGASINGRIGMGNASVAVPGVILQAGGGYSAVSSVSGDYTLSNVINGTYVITPQPAGLFNPSNITVTITSPTNIFDQNFTASTNTLAAITRGVTTSNASTSFQLSFTGFSNFAYLLQSSTNLASPTNWVTLSTNNFTTGTFNLNVTNNTTNFPQLFYRAIAK